MMTSARPRPANGPAVLETERTLSQSLIWRLQRDFYAQRGLKAWNEDLVPSYITNNPFIAEIYAGIVAAFLQDCMSRPQRDSLLFHRKSLCGFWNSAQVPENSHIFFCAS